MVPIRTGGLDLRGITLSPMSRALRECGCFRHADDEAELGPAPVIASVSLGAERRFQLKPKVATPRSQCQILLKHGSVLVMDQHVQQHWLHQIPKDKTLSAPRINLTFRQILSPQQTSSAPGERAADD